MTELSRFEGLAAVAAIHGPSTPEGVIPRRSASESGYALMRILTAGASIDIGFMRSDSDIRCAVEAELSCHPLVDDTDIAVNVKDGVVTLSGYARNLFHKYGAEDAVKRVADVAAIANTIHLHRGVRLNLTDSEIARDAVCALKRALPDCSERIRPLVCQRTITLEGTVNLPYQRQVAEDAVRRLKDAAGVINAITVAHGVDAVCIRIHPN